MNIKKILVGVSAGVLLLASTAIPVFAVKPTGNLASAVEVPWNLSAAVMPVPPYGSFDILGSDTASKLIVNQPNGNTEVTITGVMNGLNPNTTYTVYLSNGYTPYVFTEWNVTGTFVINVEYLGVDYPETLILTQSGTNITGVSLDTIPPASYFAVDSGTVIGDTITINAHKGGLLIQMVGTIAPDGSISGTWGDVPPTGSRTGTWATTSGAAVNHHTGDVTWPGLFTPTVQPFTFTTDEFGAGSWHVNMRDTDFPGTGIYDLSVWINGGGTLLISNVFQVTK